VLGSNAAGQLGDGTTTRRSTPTAVVGLASGVATVETGDGHTCAVTTGGGVKCWGYNAYGQLGDGTATSRLTPVNVTGLTSGVVMVAPGGVHTCALTSAGGVKCWGFNFSGQLGDGTTTTRYTAVDVVGLTSGVVAVATGPNHSCAATAAGTVRCWGSNSYGQLGDGTTTTRQTPVEVVGLTNATSLATGMWHTCALTSAGGVKCWGRNVYGQLGDGTTTTYYTPVDVVGLTAGITSVAAGWYHTCAVTAVGGVKCWGRTTTRSWVTER